MLFEKEGYCGTGHFAQLKTCRGAVLPSASLLNLTKPLPAAYRAGASRRVGAAGGVAGGGGGAGYAGRGFAGAAGHDRAGIPSNIWTLLESLDQGLAEPEWCPPAGAAGAEQPLGGADAFDGGGAGAGPLRGKGAARRARHAGAAEAALAAAEVD